MATFSYGPYYQSGIQAKEKQRKALTGQGYTPEELAGLNYGELMARYADAEARRTREESKALQEKQLSLQEQGLSSQERYQTGQLGLEEKRLGTQKEQYASTLALQKEQATAEEKYQAGQMDYLSRKARAEKNAQESAEKAATIAGVATGVKVADTLGVLSWGKKAITSGFTPELTVEEEIARQGAGFFESAYYTVKDIITSGTVICTELYDQGLLDEEIYRADSKFGLLLPEDILIGYKIWAVKIVKLMRRSPLFTKIISLFAIPWANEMGYRIGVKEKGNIFGKAMLFVGIPICRMIGRLLMVKGGRLQWVF